MRTRTTLAALVAAAALLAAACGSDSDDAASEPTSAPAESAAPATTAAATAGKDIVATAVEAGGFTTLAAALTQAGLVDALQGEGPFTVFAPTDEAFAAVPKETLDALLADKEALTSVLTYHVVSGNVASGDITPGPIATLAGPTLELALAGGGVTVNGAKVVAADVAASNGVIHVIDQVLLPPDLQVGEAQPATVADILAEPEFVQLGILLKAAGLEETLRGEGPFTVFAPSFEAFTALGADTLNALQRDPAALTPILTYHVVPGKVMAADVTPGEVTTVNGAPLTVTVEGDTVKVNGATVVTTDLEAGNGVVHVIDQVLQP